MLEGGKLNFFTPERIFQAESERVGSRWEVEG